MNRRKFIGVSAEIGAFSTIASPYSGKGSGIDYRQLDEQLGKPVLKRELFTSPVIIEKLELLRYQNSFICHVVSKDGAEGWSVSNNIRMIFLYPIFLQRIQPIFIGKDARNLDQLIDLAYLHDSNYKFQSYALWIPIATVEFAVLDMLGKMVSKPLGELIGKVHRTVVPTYFAPNFRDKDARTSIEEAAEMIQEKGYEAIKFKIGKKMGRDQEDVPGRTERLIPMAREILGDGLWMGVDVNGGFGIKRAIEIGRLLEANKYSFYEEPLPFDWYEELKYVTDQVSIPVAGGEQEASMHQFRWLIGNEALDVVRQDMFYFGGMIRSMKVARMAAVKNINCVPHISGSGLGFLYALHFISALPNAGPYHINSRDNDPIPIYCSTSDLQVHGGKVNVPTGPGLGVEIDRDFLTKHIVLESGL